MVLQGGALLSRRVDCHVTSTPTSVGLPGSVMVNSWQLRASATLLVAQRRRARRGPVRRSVTDSSKEHETLRVYVLEAAASAQISGTGGPGEGRVALEFQLSDSPRTELSTGRMTDLKLDGKGTGARRPTPPTPETRETATRYEARAQAGHHAPRRGPFTVG